ncbi:HNH endonuclease [Desulfosporosinus hippei]|uniref:HNH endonuclease n=1 Tax=Desulfosporosinus hippei DSM 8344 TaxID=1121419 RepID=A0A1G8L5D3_9FIRM|nr:hypothetical protein [Desulfosporosinus hippei]SDI50924.1 hypothetical protein SAMN05443529_1455 [Desulfosporosinus hippei DSM 8344]
MIRAYKYVDTIHTRLNEYVLAFFRKIEVDTNGFRDDLFEPDFLPIVKRHRKILVERFKILYKYVSSLSAAERQSFCQRVIQSNQIEIICRGEYRPEAIADKPTGINKIMKNLFLDLYNQVLDGEPFRENAHTTLRDHFNQFSNANKDITLCPICGISELKKSQDESRDQYDHFLPKSLYPFSSINFYNLVPCCIDCNSLAIKGDRDTIAISTGKLFFPYDDSHKGISLVVRVRNDNPETEKIDWELIFSSPDNKNDEIESWKTIYSIEERYQGYIGARITKWYKHYFSYIKSPKLSELDISTKEACYIEVFEQDETLGLSYIRKPALFALLAGSNTVQAEIEALQYA